MNVLIVDQKQPRNKNSGSLHAFLGFESDTLLEVSKRFENERLSYGINTVDGLVHSLEKMDDVFLIQIDNGPLIKSNFVVLATGVDDVLPMIDGTNEMWGKGVFSCAYCHAYELSNKHVSVYASGDYGIAEAIKLLSWAAKVTLLVDGGNWIEDQHRASLADRDIDIIYNQVASFRKGSDSGCVINFTDGESLKCDALFLRPKIVPRVALAGQLGCGIDAQGYLTLDRFGRTECRGLYVCGDASGQLFQAIGAAADGNKVGRWLHHHSIFGE